MTDAADPAAPSPAGPVRYLSGVQPSGRLHLGNYFGAIRGHIEAQSRPNTECFYFIANYHSLTTIQNRATLLDNTFEVALTYLALGLDPERTVFYRQSDVPEVAELAWILSTCVGMGLLERAHSYKDKVARGITPSVGLFTYPVLMAADILGPQADVVPVGQDQKQHVEMTRDMAAAFNSVYCQDREPVCKLPDARFTETPKVPGTTFDKGHIVQVVSEQPLNEAEQRTAEREAELKAALKRGLLGARTTDDVLRNGFGYTLATMPPRLTIRVLPYREDLTDVRAESAIAGKTVRVVAEAPVDTPIFRVDDAGRRVAAKMSKSYGNTIEIFAEGKALKKAVMGIETDKKELHEPLDPDDDLVFALYSLFASPDEQAEMRENYHRGGFGYGNAKKALLAKIDEHFAPAREKRRALLAKPGFVEEVLQEGARTARRVIRATTEAARDACGIPPLVRG